MPFECVGGVVGRADGFHTRLLNQTSCVKLFVSQHRGAMLENAVGGLCRQRLVNTEITLQLEVCPMVKGVSNGVGKHRGKGVKLFLPGSITRNITLLNTEGTHCAPLVMVAAEHQLANVGKTVVFRNHFRHKMAVIVNDRHILCEIIVKLLCRFVC